MLGAPQSVGDGVWSVGFRFSEDDPTFRGHFPGRPILPGVYQIEIARCAAELVLRRSFVVKEIVKAKFLRPIIPGEVVKVELKLSEKADSIQARATFSVIGQPAGEVLMTVG